MALDGNTLHIITGNNRVSKGGQYQELAGSFDTSTLNDNLIKLRVKAFGWEMNRNNFVFKEAALKATHEDAFGKEMPAWQSFEKQFVDRNHLVRDNGNSHSDQVIGFIEMAEIQEDGVYLNLILWKRTLDDDEIEQIRNDAVSVSMEVSYTQALVVIDGTEYSIADAPRYDPRSVIRTMADDSVLSFIGIAVLFDGIRPGFASADIVTVENAAMEITSVDGLESIVSTNTQLEEVMTETELATLKEQLAAFEANKLELAAANLALTEQLAAKEEMVSKGYADLSEASAKLDAAYAELNIARVKAFDDQLNSVITLEGLSDDARAFAVNLFNCLDAKSSEAFCELACNLKEAGAAVTCTPDSGMEDAGCKTKAAEVVTPTADEVLPNEEVAAVADPIVEVAVVAEIPAVVEAVVEVAKVAAVIELPSMTDLARGTSTSETLVYDKRYL